MTEDYKKLRSAIESIEDTILSKLGGDLIGPGEREVLSEILDEVKEALYGK